jgi:hypothetical protein
VHALPSLHKVPLGAAGLKQAPVVGLHVPAWWQGSGAAQVIGLAPLQVPAWHVSVCVQRLPSSQAVPSLTGGFEQAPVPWSHTPTAWHWSSAVQVTGVPLQRPSWQLSDVVQASESLQAVPSGWVGFVHAPVSGLHVPGW